MKRLALVLLILLVLIVTGCGRDRGDSRVLPYYERFVAEAQKRGVEFDTSVSIFIEKNDSTKFVEAVCRNKSSGSPTIILNPSWLDLKEEAKELVLFHELGHCALKREHTEPLEALNATKGIESCDMLCSIMAPGISAAKYSERRNDYLDELFKR